MAKLSLFLLIVGLVASANSQSRYPMSNPFPQEDPGFFERLMDEYPIIRDVKEVFESGFKIAPGVSVRPTFDFGTKQVGIEFRINFKRSVSQPKKEAVFSLLDIDGNGSLCVEEWHAHKGGVVNFASFLKAVDDDGNEEVSWTEFQTVKGIHTQDTAEQSTQAPE